MAKINYSVQAEVVDINADKPKAEDIFLVDTNVWYWMTYTRASQCTRPPASYQTSSYPDFTNAALGVGAKIFQSLLSLAELAHLIERAEYEIFAQTNPVTFPDPSKFDKNFRHSRINERKQTVSEIKTAWAQASSLASPLDVSIDAATSNSALKRLETQKVDGYDLFILESMKANGIKQIITDDGDFCSVPGIRVFTANRNVISAAKSQKKLLSR